MRTAAPPNIETAYERAIAVLQLAQPPGEAADGGRRPVDDAVDQGVVDVDQGAGEVLAAAHQDDVVEVVLEQVAPGGPGEQRSRAGRRPGPGWRPYWSVGDADADDEHAPWWRRVTVRALTGESPSACPVTGSSQCRKRSPMLKNPPAKTEPKASTIIGIVMDFGRLVRVRLVALRVRAASASRRRRS